MRIEDLIPPGVDAAIKQLRPNVEGMNWNYIIAGERSRFDVWEDPLNRKPPTYQEIMDVVEEQKELYENYVYLWKREEEYGFFKDQLEMIYKDIKNKNLEDGEFVNHIDRVKKKFPGIQTKVVQGKGLPDNEFLDEKDREIESLKERLKDLEDRLDSSLTELLPKDEYTIKHGLEGSIGGGGGNYGDNATQAAIDAIKTGT